MRRFLLGVGIFVCLAGAFLIGPSGKAPGGTGERVLRMGATPPASASGFPKTEAAINANPTSSPAIVQKYEQLPLAFEPNLGQANARAQFLARGRGYTAFLAPTGTVVALHTTSTRKAAEGGLAKHNSQFPTSNTATRLLRMDLIGANLESRLYPLDELPGKSNYLIGNVPANWHTNIPNYRKVAERGIYPGIDLVYYGNQRQLEYDFVLAPGAAPHSIRLRIRGAEKLRINLDGELIASVPGADVRFHKPVAYQQIDQEKRAVAATFVLENARTVAFHVGAYDPRRPLIIDPILSYSTYLGGSNIDGANAIAVATDGTAFIAGGTFSADFPTAHPLQPNAGGGNDFPQDAFVAKLSADGSALLYSTYLGGQYMDVANGIAVDAFGDAYVTGTTISADFPAVPGSFDTMCGGDGKCGSTLNINGLIVENGFVTKLNAAGSGLIYSGFVGGDENVRCQAIAVDSNEVAYVTGQVEQNGPVGFPITANALQPQYGGGATDAFVMKISATGTGIQYSTYLGGSDEDTGYGIAVDNNANAYVTGLTYSSPFPVLNGVQLQPLLSGAQGAYGGAGDAFVAKLSTAGSGGGAAPLLYSTYLGGSGLDQGNGIVLDSTGIVYVAGATGSSSLPFTATGSLKGGADAFAAKLDATKSGAASLLYFVYFGGSAADSGNGIAVDPSGNAYVTGSTVSTDFPTTPAVFQPKYGGGNADAFVTKLDPTGAIAYSSFLGGTNTDIGYGIAVDTSGSAYVAGQTCSQDFPLAYPLQAAPGGNCDAFISKVAILSGIALNPAGLVFPAQSLGTTSQSQVVTLTNGDAPQTITSITITGADPGDFAESYNCPASLAPGGQCAISVTFTPTVTGIRKAAVTIIDSAPGSPHVLNLSGSTSTLTLSASSLSFGNQHVGVTSSPQAITATNQGTVAIAISSITASGDFAETDDCTKAPLQHTTNCVINVTYTPTTAGSSTGALTLTDNAPGSPQIVLLTGTGVGQQSDFTLSVQPPSATIPAGKPAQYTVSISSLGGFSQPVTLSCAGLPAASSCSASSNPVTPSGTTNVTLTIATGARALVPPSRQIRVEPPYAMRILGSTWIVLLMIVLVLSTVMRELRGRWAISALALVLTVMLLSVACGGGGASGVPSGTPAGNYQITVGATSGSITHTATIGLQVN